MPAKIIGRDPSSDLAVIQAENVTGAKPATLGSSANLVVGESVVAIGSPLGLSGTVTSGIVSALNRPVSTGTSSTSGGAAFDAIQTDAAINPGNSGGALANLAGQVVGINSAIATLGTTVGSQSGSIGLGFSIPIDQAKRIADELIKSGQATKPQLGVTVGDAPNGGAQIGTVTAGGAAAKAGLKAGRRRHLVRRPADRGRQRPRRRRPVVRTGQPAAGDLRAGRQDADHHGHPRIGPLDHQLRTCQGEDDVYVVLTLTGR